MRAFVCLTIQPEDGALAAFAICAHDRATALAHAISTIAKQQGSSASVVGVLTQEEITAMGMLLAAGRAGMSAKTHIEA